MASHIVRHVKRGRGGVLSWFQAGRDRVGKLGRLQRRPDAGRPDPNDGVEEQSQTDAFAKRVIMPPRGRLRHVRILRDYGMFDRREAPQYYPPVERE